MAVRKTAPPKISSRINSAFGKRDAMIQNSNDPNNVFPPSALPSDRHDLPRSKQSADAHRFKDAVTENPVSENLVTENVVTESDEVIVEQLFDIDLSEPETELSPNLLPTPTKTTESCRHEYSESVSRRKNPRKMYCRSCWRDDQHYPVNTSVFVKTALVLCTLGVAYLFWPYYCSTCGKSRLKQWRRG